MFRADYPVTIVKQIDVPGLHSLRDISGDFVGFCIESRRDSFPLTLRPAAIVLCIVEFRLDNWTLGFVFHYIAGVPGNSRERNVLPEDRVSEYPNLLGRRPVRMAVAH